MIAEQIRNIENLIQVKPGKRIISHEIKRLTAPGENYGSLMLSVDLNLTSRNGDEKLYTVAKMVPPNELIQQIFDTQNTFRNEIAFYKKIVPLLQNFQKEQGVTEVIDFVAKYYGSRLNLKNDDNDEVEKDAALVLENLKMRNFITWDRTAGLDIDAVRLVLKNLALLHAVPLALKMKKPEVFEKEIKPYLKEWSQQPEFQEKGKKNLEKHVEKIDEIKMLKERVIEGFDRMKITHEPREPFATITHNDCWTNNNMFRLEGGTAVESKLVDFQVYSYGSPARDLIFFLFSSVKNKIIEENYEELLKRYHQTFVSVLKELRCDITPFTFEALQQELDFEAKHSQFGHVIFMLFPIYLDHDEAKDPLEFNKENMAEMKISEKYKQQLTFFIKESVKRNWI